MFIIETDRLKLRRFSKEDAETFYKLNANSNVLKYTGDQPFKSINAASEFISNYNHYALHDYGRWSVVVKSTNKCIGWCGLKNVDDLIDVGFRFLETYWNQGFATESANAVLEYGFNHFDLNMIIGRCSINHEASAKVLLKIGMKWWKEDHENAIGALGVFRKFNPT